MAGPLPSGDVSGLVHPSRAMGALDMVTKAHATGQQLAIPDSVLSGERRITADEIGLERFENDEVPTLLWQGCKGR